MFSDRKAIDQVSGWLTLYDDGFVDRTWTGPPQFKFMSDTVPPHHHFIDGVATHDLSIDTNTNLRVRIYLPELPDSTQKLPIILHFHGGGFCISQADWFMYYNFYMRLAREAKAIVVSTYLRLAPECRLPAAINDGYSTLLWLQDLENRKTHQSLLSSNGDFSRIFLLGDSTGGNIVHQVAKKSAGENMGVAGAILIHPGFLRSVRSKSELENPESPFLTLDMLDKFLKLGLPEGSTKDHQITCPMAEPLEGLDLPPYLVCVAEQDLMIATEVEFYEAMKKSGNNVKLLVSPEVGHSFYLNKIAIDVDPVTSKQTHKLIQEITHFIRNH
ncbi:probable carboxylesterase 6 [Cynara cardunculus var. scolymus]|uniref:Alpha/beta hydrolase fold-3 n=1 Tax=Cynara cardunculus var. scolymus TaxID=59895 RepID=A0A103YLR0_CYNCS|nr:probable carboxylesterase 6 [Cynara cardunculus var. scolymus]KVI11409.1 Alpha/beta hydrolase fold-3 [Cynara cardunculus var. scolymus]